VGSFWIPRFEHSSATFSSEGTSLSQQEFEFCSIWVTSITLVIRWVCRYEAELAEKMTKRSLGNGRPTG